MRTVRFASKLVGFALLFLILPSLLAQVVNGGPYTLTRKTTNVQHLSNGVTITRESTAKEARDSNGRTYQEIPPMLPSENAEQSAPTSYSVSDPVNRVSISWASNTKIADVYHWAEPKPTQEATSQPAKVQKLTAAAQTELAKMKLVRLGTKIINGIETEGLREIKTVPAGEVGNDQPFTVTKETWFASSLHAIVLSTTDDPLTGVTTIEITDIDRSEPDPMLFQVPEGYAMMDRNPNQQN